MAETYVSLEENKATSKAIWARKNPLEKFGPKPIPLRFSTVLP